MSSPLATVVGTRVGAGLAALPGVRAVALGGSLTSPFADGTSDVDLYVYADTPPPVEQRAEILGDGRDIELNNQFWETGDEWLDTVSGVAIDVMYRSPAWVESELDRLLVHHQASTGYTTAIWHNVKSSRVLVDPSGWFATLKVRADQPYPEGLRRAIIAKNHPILRSVKGAYRNQIATALDRDDVVSVNHRLAVLLASVFDILFAVNRQPHSGEKRLLAWTEAVCELRPAGFSEQVRATVAASGDGFGLLPAVDALLDGIDELLRQTHLLDADELTL